MPKSRTRKRKASQRKHKPAGSSLEIISDDLPPIFDRRSMDRTMSNLQRLLSQREFDSPTEMNNFLSQFNHLDNIPAPSNLTPLEQAQDVMYEAFEASGPKRIELSRRALEISPDCADAWVLLAEEEARTPQKALEYYEKGVQAGERALGPQAFADNVGHFWAILETRPYMRARAGLAEVLWHLGKRQEAMAHYREMLRLNPNDNQGMRDLLIRCLLKVGDDQGVGELLDQYKDSGMAEWLYTRALHTFRVQGDSPPARAALQEALKQNRHVPPYLTGKKKQPPQLPPYMGFGDDHEAVHYVAHHFEFWLKTPGAQQWLLNNLGVKTR